MKFRNKTERQNREKELQEQKLNKYISEYKTFKCFRVDQLTEKHNNNILFLIKKIRRLKNILNFSTNEQ